MVSNVSNRLKKRVINSVKISNNEASEFVDYMVKKTKLIVDRMYNKNYNYMFLFYEVAFSYDLLISPINTDSNCAIINISGFYFLVDMNFNNPGFLDLYKNKYACYNEENYLKYIRLCGDNIE